MNSSGESAASLQHLQAAFARMLGKQQGAAAGATEEIGTSDVGPSQVASQVQSSTADGLGTDDQQVTPASILEAMLFVGHPKGEPLSPRLLAAVMRGVTPAEIDQFVEKLNRQYEEDGQPYWIQAYGDGYRMALRDEFEPLRLQIIGRVRHARLNQEAVDVLAIVAYEQPVDADVVDQLRGKPSHAILRALVRRQLISVERSPQKRSQRIYRTTQRFLDLLDLDSLDQLPQGEDLERAVR